MSNSKYRLYKKKTLSNRQNDYQKITKKYPNQTPVLVDSNIETENAPRVKYLLPNDMTLSQFLFIYRKRMNLNPETALIVFIKNTLPTMSTRVCDIRKDLKDADGFVSIHITEENTFG